MKRLLLISVLLAFLSAPPAANALTAENIAVSASGGIVVSGEASSSGSTSADAGVKSVIRSDGSSTQVRIEISAGSDEEVRATTSSRTVGNGRFEVIIPESNTAAEAEVTEEVSISATSTPSSNFLSAWVSLKASFAKLYHLLFFWDSN